MSNIATYQGKIDEAIDVLDKGISADQIERYEGGWYPFKMTMKGWLYGTKKDFKRAAAEADLYAEIYQKVTPNEDFWWRREYVILMAECQEFSKAEDALRSMESSVESDRTKMRTYRFAKGWLEMEKGNMESACREFEKAIGHPRRTWNHYGLALAYLKARRFGDAVNEFETLFEKDMITLTEFPLFGVRAHYYLGLAYEGSGSHEKATKQYERFLDIWRDADPDLEEVDDAKRRLAGLRGES